jgi:uncharacterized membrane protein
MSVTWLTLALLSTAISAIVNTLDSHFLTQRLPSLRSYLFIIGAFTVLVGLALLLIFPLPPDVGSRPVAAAVFSALFRVAAVYLFLYAMKEEDVSRIIPLNSTAPIFVAIMAAAFLGERLSGLQWLAIGVVVSGAVLISFKRTEGGGHHFHARSFFMVIGSAVLFAVGDVANKYALEEIPFQSTAGLMLTITSLVFVAAGCRPRVWREIKALERPAATTAAVLANQVAAVGAILLGYWAIQNGPVSLASTIFNSKPLFVFVYTLAFARFAPGFLLSGPGGRGETARKLAATLLIVGGLALIVLS